MSRVVLLNFDPYHGEENDVRQQLQRYQSTTHISMQTHINDPELLGRYPASSLSVGRPASHQQAQWFDGRVGTLYPRSLFSCV